MRIMSERRFQEELAKAKEEIYQREQADRRMMEIHHRIDELQHDLFDLQCKVEGPCSEYEELDLVHRYDVLALTGDVFFSDGNGGAHHIHYIDPERVKELPSIKTTERLIAKIVFDEEKMREIVNEAIKPYRSIRGRRRRRHDSR